MFGLPLGFTGLAMLLYNKNLDELDQLKQVDFLVLPFEKFPGFVRVLLGSKRKNLMRLGFVELVCFTRTNLGMPNFCSVLISPDKSTVACLEYARLSALITFVLLFIQPSDFFRNLLGLHGMSLMSVFPPHRRFISTTAAYLKRDAIPLVKEFNIVSSKLSYAEIYNDHNLKVKQLCEEQRLTTIIFESVEQYFSYEREWLKSLAHRLEREVTDTHKNLTK